MLKARLNSLFVLILPVGIAVGIVPAQTLGVNTITPHLLLFTASPALPEAQRALLCRPRTAIFTEQQHKKLVVERSSK